MSKNKRWFSCLLRIIVATFILVFLIRFINIETVRLLFHDITLPWVFLACGIIVLVRVILAIRWKVILADSGILIPLRTLLRIIYISIFIGGFLPGSIGPDLVRGYRLVKTYGQQTGEVALSLLIDRVIGAYVMIFVAFIGVLVAELTGKPSGLLIPLIVVQVSLLLTICVSDSVIKKLKSACILKNTRLGNLWYRLLVTVSKITVLLKKKRMVLQILALSLLVIAIRCFIFYCLYRAFGVTLPLVSLVIFIPIMFVAVLIPVSIGGLGVRETALVCLFGSIGVASEASISVGILFQLLLIVASLPGLPLWLADKGKPFLKSNDLSYSDQQQLKCSSSIL